MKSMKSILTFSIVLILLFACKRNDADFLGPAYISAPSGFSVVSFTATPTTVDLSTSKVEFNANFSNAVSWTLTITGKKSGATRQFRGIGSTITNLQWNGSNDGVTFFRQGEIVTATLSFYGTSLVSSIDITLTGVPDYRTCVTFYPKYSDFETPSRIKTPNWSKYNAAEQGVDSMAKDYNGALVPSVQGKNYYYIRGLGTQPVFVDGIQYVGGISPSLPADPDNVWVNIYIYGTGSTNTAVDVEYQEADFDGTSANYSGTDDDAFVAHIIVDHVGWKLFSFKYSSLVPSSNPDFGGSGNKIHEPANLKSFDVILLKRSNPDSPAEVYFDFPVFTVGGPFKPCK